MIRKSAKKIGLFTLILITINSILGSGIFALPGTIFRSMAGNFWIAILVSTIMAGLLSVVFSYAAKYVKKSGAAYAYAKAAFGNFWGSFVGIMKVFTTILVNATLITISVKQLGIYLKSFGGPNIGYEGAYWLIGWAVIAAVLTIYTFILTNGAKASAFFTNIVTIAKLLPIIVLIVVGVTIIGKHAGNFSIAVTKSGHAIGVSGIISGIIALFYAYLGFDSLANSAESYKNPGKNIPLALMVTMLVLSVVYTLLLIIGISGLPPTVLYDRTKSILGEAARATVLGDFGFHFIMVGSLISMFGITFMALFYTPFVWSQMARDGLLPNVLTLRNRKNAYYVAAWSATIISILISFTGSFIFLARLNVFSRFSQFIPSALAVMVFRRRYKKAGEKVTFWKDLPSILSIMIIIALIVMEFIPLGATTHVYHDKLIKMAWSGGFVTLALLIAFFYARYNMNAKETGDNYKIYLDESDLRGKVKKVMLWIFVPFFMLKRRDRNFEAFYVDDKTTWPAYLQTKSVPVKRFTDSATRNDAITGENEVLVARSIRAHLQKTLLLKHQFLEVVQISHVIFDYEKMESEFYVKYLVRSFKNKPLRYTSYYNKVKITEQISA